MRADSGRKSRGVSASVELYFGLAKMIFEALFCKSCRFFFSFCLPRLFQNNQGAIKHIYKVFLTFTGRKAVTLRTKGNR